MCGDVGLASTTPNMDAPDNYQTTYDSKTKIVVFYSLNDKRNIDTRKPQLDFDHMNKQANAKAPHVQ